MGFTVQTLKVTPLIRTAEIFEETAKAQATLSGKPAGTVMLATASGGSPLLDAGVNLGASLLTGVGFGLVLAGTIAFWGRVPTLTEGLFWGFAGFAVFTLAPALVLPPHLPGMAESGLGLRQLWWLGAAGTAAAGLGLAVFARNRAGRVLGLALLALPFIASGPEPVSGAGAPLPPTLISSFVASSIAASAVFWAALGVAISVIYGRFWANRAS